MNTGKLSNFPIWCAALLTCSLCLSGFAVETTPDGSASGQDRHFETLTVGALEFVDVWVHRQTNAVILIRHSRGIHSINLTDLPADELEELKAQVGQMADVPKTRSGWSESGLLAKLSALFEESSPQTKIFTGLVAALSVTFVMVRSVGKKTALPTGES
jgi:hypothetical protein